MTKFIKNNYLLPILLIALILRLITIDQSLWLDESIGAWAVTNFSYQGILNDFLLSDNHPPLYYLLLKLWTSIFGFSELSIRMPSVLFGLGTIYFTYRIARLIFVNSKRRIPELSAVMLATSQFHIYYSQEARMYSMAAFFATASIYYFIKILNYDIKSDWVLFSSAVTLMIFSDYMPIFMLPVYFVSALLFKKDKNWWLKFFATFLPLALLGLLWLPTFMIQSQKGKWLLETLPAWRDLAGGATIKQAALLWMKMILGRISFIPKIFYYSLVLLASIPISISLVKAMTVKKSSGAWKVIWIWLVMPTSFSFIVSFIFPAFIYFRLLFVLPALYLLIIFGLSNFNDQFLQKTLIISILLLNLISIGIYYFDKDQHREDWKSAVEFVESRVTGADVVLFEYPEPFTPYSWYTTKPQIAFGATNSISADKVRTIDKTSNLIENKDRIFHFYYLKDLSDPNKYVEFTMSEHGFEEVEVVNFKGVGQVSIWEK